MRLFSLRVKDFDLGDQVAKGFWLRPANPLNTAYLLDARVCELGRVPQRQHGRRQAGMTALVLCPVHMAQTGYIPVHLQFPSAL